MKKELLKEKGYIVFRVDYGNDIIDSVVVRESSKLFDNINKVKETRHYGDYNSDIIAFGTNEMGRHIDIVENEMIDYALENLD